MLQKKSDKPLSCPIPNHMEDEQHEELHRLYEYKGNKYWLIEEILGKDSISRQWVPYYLYRTFPATNSKLFTRNKFEFLDRFTKVEYDKQL